MPNGRKHKDYYDYGPHEYPEADATFDCKYGCGCWAGPARSGGPAGIDPFGLCPNNPIDGQRQKENDDYEDIVNGRIQKLEREVQEGRRAIKLIEKARKETKIDLAKRLKNAEKKLLNQKDIFRKINEMAQRIHESASVAAESK